MYTNADKKHVQAGPLPQLSGELQGAVPSGVPNSAMLSMLEGAQGGGLPDLEQRMRERLALDHQIPSAEREADRLAASVSGARTPDEVKAQLGEKMGADFSNVRFHTDAGAVGMADNIGARAYTSPARTSTSAREASTPLWRPTSWSTPPSRGWWRAPCPPSPPPPAGCR